jgi:UDP-N-acetylglucosamine--N-acetylmuramyl-(pentapeptide) pyrophosphoryl-undecaprenol N-acetylglucosamine transferase
MKIIISGGGTGGHIYPAIAIANALKRYDPTANLLFVGAIGKMEMKKVPEAGYPIVGLGIRGFQRRRILPNIVLPFRLAASLRKAQEILRDFQPDVVVGTGGYASAPVLYMAARQKIPTLIQEQNAAVGLTNRMLANHVDVVCGAYESIAAYFPGTRTVLTGNPVREDLIHLSGKKEEAHAYFGLAPDKKCLLVLGGSLGAGTINESILQALDPLLEVGLQIIWVTGPLYFEEIKAKLTQRQQNIVKVYSFIEAIDLAYAMADIVVSRAGALAVAELCVAQKPVVFVPSPNVTADHQTQNVRPLVEKNAALMVRDNEAMQTLAQEVIDLLQNKDRQSALAQNIKHWARPQATAAVVKEIIRLVDPASAESVKNT